ncbi:hypothetical protein SAMN04244553_1167 [Nocardia amikacinitolerans]|uniref:Uncharacterized protein n=1 Tax=Nocardia amikacinitolerans TaxID=756689 RepID=A0A285KZD9_9NOCA|nr:hypothetical protein [Nocardia amikacinitolerans]MCP2296944.1 hypothetical protein [Nocardia amikacinitolerans]SNY78030.1 hypothetical protein SAMN04244553_1167 [Nocardia amikacinitolerans]
MFRLLAQLSVNPSLAFPPPAGPADAEYVFGIHPLQLSRWLEEIWGSGGLAAWGLPPPLAPLGTADVDRRLQLPQALLDDLRSGIGPGPGAVPPGPVPPDFVLSAADQLGSTFPWPWDHLIYAYLIESTRIVDILGEVVRRYLVGESLDAPSVQTLVWLRNTEELFFRDPPLFQIGGLTSSLRPDARVNRRNAYWRMFGFDLPFPLAGKSEAQPWKIDVGTGTNTRFLELWNELLRQVWLGIENDKNAVGANPTDPAYVAYLCQTLGELLRQRRRGGMLAREEFAYVCMLSWFHLTVESDTSVVADLKATAGVGGNPADRLSSIGAHVGIAPTRSARELFELSDLLSPLIWFIELDVFSTPATASVLFNSFGLPNPPFPTAMTRVIDLWQSATGERVKDLAVTTRTARGRAAQPTRLPTGAAFAGLPGQIAATRDGVPAWRRAGEYEHS